jgi:hypothetical protein
LNLKNFNIGKIILLGMRDEGRKEFSDEDSPHALTFADAIIVTTHPLFILQEGVVTLNGEALI